MLVKIRIKEMDEQVKDILREIDIVQNKIDTQKEYIKKLSNRSDVEIQSEIEKIDHNKNAIDKYNTHIQGLQHEIDKLKNTIHIYKDCNTK